MQPNEDDFWEDLLTLIEDRKVIPIIGQRAVTVSLNARQLWPKAETKPAETLCAATLETPAGSAAKPWPAIANVFG